MLPSLPDRIAQARQCNSNVYEHASLLCERLRGVTLRGDKAAITDALDAITRLEKELGPQDPFEEPGIFKVEKIDSEDWLITCPYCDNGFVVHGPTWVKGGNPEEGSRSTRQCPYCGEEAYHLDKRPQWQRNRDR